ncbi:MAG: ABC transporter ATP-binding protein [bacterium]
MIEIRGLVKYLGGQLVLDHLDLDIGDGETTVIIGRSGCGKSVLLKHIIGLMKPDAGTIRVDGVEITKLGGREFAEIQKRFGMLFQGSALFDSMTVEENVGFSLREHTSASEEEVRRRVIECLRIVGLKDVEGKRPSELSGGMQKRVALARAIAMNPQFILYDEPTTGLDPITADAITDLMIDLQKRLGVTSIVVTHDIVSAYKIANSIAMLYGGRIIERGTPEEIKNTANPYVRQFITGSSRGPIDILT